MNSLSFNLERIGNIRRQLLQSFDNYFCTVWSEAKNSSNVDRLFKLQKRAARIILGVRDVLTPTHTLLRQIKWMPLLDYFIFRKLILNFKVLHHMTPEYLNVFKYVHEVNTRVTRQSLDNDAFYPQSTHGIFLNY